MPAPAPAERSTEHAEPRPYAQLFRESLERTWLTRLGDLTAVPRVVIDRRALLRVDLDARAGFVLSLVDGASSYETVIDLSVMDRFEALRILVDLLDRRVIA